MTRTTTFHSKYSTDIETMGAALGDDFKESSDPSQDLILCLALAYKAAQRLKDSGVSLADLGNDMIFPHVKHAFRQATFIRARRVPTDMLDVRKISRFSRLVE